MYLRYGRYCTVGRYQLVPTTGVVLQYGSRYVPTGSYAGTHNSMAWISDIHRRQALSNYGLPVRGSCNLKL